MGAELIWCVQFLKHCIKKEDIWNFPGGSVARNWCFHCWAWLHALLTQLAFLWSTCGKWRGDGLGAEGVWFPPGGLRGYLRPEEPWRNAWLITKGVINYAGWGVQSHSVNIGLGGKKGGRRCFPPLLDMPVGLSLLWSCQEEAYLKARFAFMLFSLRKIPANSQTRHQIHWFTFSGEGKKKKITVS